MEPTKNEDKDVLKIFSTQDQVLWDSSEAEIRIRESQAASSIDHQCKKDDVLEES